MILGSSPAWHAPDVQYWARVQATVCVAYSDNVLVAIFGGFEARRRPSFVVRICVATVAWPVFSA
jgi:hypothetical protein